MSQTPRLGTRNLIARWALAGWLAGVLMLPLLGPAAGQPPEQPTPIMPLDEVRIGMKGYGLTVLHGTEIEPFAVEVVSVVPNSDPKRGVIWIECDHPTLEVSGPVQGMSGSPIYLWDEGESGDLGEGGRLIGAFAFGFSGVKVPLVGVQPIEYMRETGTRAAQARQDPAAHRQALARPRDGRLGLRALDRLAESAKRAQLSELETLRLTLAREALARAAKQPRAERAMIPLPAGPAGFDGQAQPMQLPMAVGSAQTATMLEPLFADTALIPVAGRNLIGGRPPQGTDPDTPIRPGSVLAIPLAFGDVDLSAAGTATDVLPDGTVLGFGHPMFGEGPTAVPMASGYVHFVAPRITLSFKRAGSLKILGSIVRDESAAVAGIDQPMFTTAPVSITIDQPGIDKRSYQFEVVHDEKLTPGLVATVYAMSVAAIHAAPTRSTLHLTGSMSFEGDRTVEFDTALPTGNTQAALMEVMPALTLATQNPFQYLKLTEAELHLRVEDGLRFATIDAARADRRNLRPGDTVALTVALQRFEGPIVERRVELDLPADLPPGDYQVFVSDAGRYANRLTQSQPYRFEANDVDDVMQIARDSMALDREALYVSLPTHRKGLAIGRQNLTGLPSSKAALVGRTAGSALTEFVPMIDASLPMPMVVQGEVAVPITVVEPDAK
jgi:hypothetical protein